MEGLLRDGGRRVVFGDDPEVRDRLHLRRGRGGQRGRPGSDGKTGANGPERGGRSAPAPYRTSPSATPRRTSSSSSTRHTAPTPASCTPPCARRSPTPPRSGSRVRRSSPGARRTRAGSSGGATRRGASSTSTGWRTPSTTVSSSASATRGGPGRARSVTRRSSTGASTTCPRPHRREKQAALLSSRPPSGTSPSRSPMIRGQGRGHAGALGDQGACPAVASRHRSRPSAGRRPWSITTRCAWPATHCWRELAEFDPESVAGTPLEKLPVDQRYLHQAYQFRALLRRIDFVPVISPGSAASEGMEGLDRPRRQKAYIERFQKAFPHAGARAGVGRGDPLQPTAAPAPPTDAAGGMNTPGPRSREQRTAAARHLGARPRAPRQPRRLPDREVHAAHGLRRPARAGALPGPADPRRRTAPGRRPGQPHLPGKEVGYVVDYYGVFEHLSSALAGYRDADVTTPCASSPRRSTGSGPPPRGPRLPAAQRHHDARARPARQAGARRARPEDEDLRFDFDEVLHEFLATLERVLPHEEAWTTWQTPGAGACSRSGCAGCAGTHEGGTFTLRRYGRKVRAMIADHLEGPEIEQVIPPVSLTAPHLRRRRAALPPRRPPPRWATRSASTWRSGPSGRTPRSTSGSPSAWRRSCATMPGPLRGADRGVRHADRGGQAGAGGVPGARRTQPLEQRAYRLVDQLLEDTPGSRLASSGDVSAARGQVCDVATQSMAKASYQGQHQDISTLAGASRKSCSAAVSSPSAADWAALENIGERLASFARTTCAVPSSRDRGENRRVTARAEDCVSVLPEAPREPVLTVDGLSLRVRASARRKRFALTVETDAGPSPCTCPSRAPGGRGGGFRPRAPGWLVDKRR